jgi:hypothetical protein
VKRVASTFTNGALASVASRRAISVLPTPVGWAVRAPPAVAQGDGDRALCRVLADDVAVELGDDLARGHGRGIGHREILRRPTRQGGPINKTSIGE